MTYSLNNFRPSASLAPPSQLLSSSQPVQQLPGATPQLSGLPQRQQPMLSAAPLQQPAPAMRPDQSRFSRVSQMLGLPPLLPILSQLPRQILTGLDRGWQTLKDTFTFQFEEKGRLGTAKEAQANCGPASATMILKQFGLPSPTMQQLRRSVGAPVGTGGGAFALTTRQVGESVRKAAADKGVRVTYEIKSLPTNVDRVLAEMKRRLDAGEKVILLSSNLNSLSRGHYIVVNEVRADGSIIVDDPGRSNGENQRHTKAQLAKALSMRVNTYGLENTLLSFKRQA
ncbi:MAG: C39 family peptidase [Candidatus Sericytochromatia bacterium]